MLHDLTRVCKAMGSGAVSNMANGSFSHSERPQKEVRKLKWGVVLRIVTLSGAMRRSYVFSFRLGSLMMFDDGMLSRCILFTFILF